MRATDVKPSRLGAAQAAVRQFLDKVPPNVRVALVAFAGDPQVAAPPTTDHELVRQALDSLDYFSGFGGTAIGDALATAVELVKPPPPERRADDRLHDRDQDQEPGLDPLPVGRPSDPRAAPTARGRRTAREAPASPSTRSRSGRRTACSTVGRPRRRVRRRRRGRIRPATDSRSARPGDAAPDRADHRREVLRRPLVEGARVRVRASRLPGRPRAGQDRDHERVPLPGRSAARRRRPAVGALLAAVALDQAATRTRPATLSRAQEPADEQAASDRQREPGPDRDHEKDDPLRHPTHGRYRPGQTRTKEYVRPCDRSAAESGGFRMACRLAPPIL